MRFTVDRIIPELGGRWRLATGARTRKQHQAALALVDRLLQEHRFDLLDDLHKGRLTWGDLFNAARENRLGMVRADLALRKPLWATVEALWPEPNRTSRRYRVSFLKLRRLGLLPDKALVRDLADVDWRRLAASEAFRSGSDWNHLRRAVSRLCTLLTHEGHPFWKGLKADGRFPIRPERERMPDLSLDELGRFLDALPGFMRAPALCLMATGLRWGEYRRLTRAHLGHYLIRVPGTKTAASARLLPVDPSLWPVIEAAVPCPRAYKAFRGHWDAALEVAGIPDFTRHDCRHLAAQLLNQAGRPLTAIQATLGHSSASQTAKYAKQRLKREDAAAMASQVGPLVGKVLDGGVLPMRRRA